MKRHLAKIVRGDRTTNHSGVSLSFRWQKVSRDLPGTLNRLALGLVAVALNFSITQPLHGAAFTSTGALATSRAGHATTLLAHGKVLTFGGFNGGGPGRLASAELYDPATETWIATGSLNLGRTTATAALLGNGLVLAAGGHDSASTSTASTELYNPATGLWAYTGSMTTARGNHTATLLANGKVLVVGGRNRTGGYDVFNAELYDPANGTWSNAGSLTTGRDTHTATLLLNGKVLVVGGAPDGAQFASLSSVELYNPATGTWTATGSLITARQGHTATLLPDGRVLVAAGFKEGYFMSSSEIYDPVTGLWTPTGSMGTARGVHTATLLPDGKVLAVGGNYNTLIAPGIVTQSSAEVYDAAAGTWAATSSLLAARTTHTASLLPSGQVLITGGFNVNANTWLFGGELYGSVSGPISLMKPVKLAGGAFQFAFTGAPNGTNTVLAATNATLPITSWTEIGRAGEFAPGLFFFSDSQATNSPQRFYCVRSP